MQLKCNYREIKVPEQLKYINVSTSFFKFFVCLLFLKLCVIVSFTVYILGSLGKVKYLFISSKTLVYSSSKNSYISIYFKNKLYLTSDMTWTNQLVQGPTPMHPGCKEASSRFGSREWRGEGNAKRMDVKLSVAALSHHGHSS